jgi:hypothetical protein
MRLVNETSRLQRVLSQRGIMPDITGARAWRHAPDLLRRRSGG